MARADHDPVRAEADMQRLQNEAAQADSKKDDAESLVEQLESQMDVAHAAGDEAEVERLQSLHQQAEIDLAAAIQDFDSVMDQIDNAQTFWFEEDD